MVQACWCGLTEGCVKDCGGVCAGEAPGLVVEEHNGFETFWPGAETAAFPKEFPQLDPDQRDDPGDVFAVTEDHTELLCDKAEVVLVIVTVPCNELSGLGSSGDLADTRSIFNQCMQVYQWVGKHRQGASTILLVENVMSMGPGKCQLLEGIMPAGMKRHRCASLPPCPPPLPPLRRKVWCAAAASAARA